MLINNNILNININKYYEYIIIKVKKILNKIKLIFSFLEFYFLLELNNLFASYLNI